MCQTSPLASSFLQKGLKRVTRKSKCIILWLCAHIHTVFEETGELYLSQTTVEGEREVGDEVENINGVKSAYIKAIR